MSFTKRKRRYEALRIFVIDGEMKIRGLHLITCLLGIVHLPFFIFFGRLLCLSVGRLVLEKSERLWWCFFSVQAKNEAQSNRKTAVGDAAQRVSSNGVSDKGKLTQADDERTRVRERRCSQRRCSERGSRRFHSVSPGSDPSPH